MEEEAPVRTTGLPQGANRHRKKRKEKTVSQVQRPVKGPGRKLLFLATIQDRRSFTISQCFLSQIQKIKDSNPKHPKCYSVLALGPVADEKSKTKG